MVGRERDLEMLLACRRNGSVTLVGPGGVGKTRLALEAAHRFAGEGRRAFWADLTTVAADRLVDALAEVTGVVMPRGADPGGVLGASLRGTSALLCLDNAESVLAELAPVVEALADAAPRLLILATSRERLGVAGEHVHQLPPLPLPSGPDRDNPAIRLFLERAQGLEAVPSDDDLDAIAELCRRLDGLPLAIELGAARAPAFGIREFTAQIAGELDLLAGGRRTAAARHRTLTGGRRRLVPVAGARGGSSVRAARRVPRTVPVGAGTDGVRRRPAAGRRDRRGAGPARRAVAGAGGRRPVPPAGDAAHLRRRAPRRAGPARLRARHARDVADRIAELQWQQRPASEPECVAALSAMTADLHQAWDHAVHHDRDLAVELAALIYDFAYQRQRLDLLDWGLQVADWDLDHPLLSQALATAATAAWAAGELEPRRGDRVARHPRAPRQGTGRRAAGPSARPATSRCSWATSTRQSRGSRRPSG